MRDLSPTEQRVLDLLGQAADTFTGSLGEAHPDDRSDFIVAIHAAQNIVLARPATEQQQERREQYLEGSDEFEWEHTPPTPEQTLEAFQESIRLQQEALKPKRK